MSDVTVTSTPTVTRVRVPGGRKKKAGSRHGVAGFLFTAPFMVLFVLLFIAPLLYALYLSLFREQLVGGNSFVGLDNYTDGLKDAAFTDGVKRVALFMVVQVPVMLILALAFALIIDAGSVKLGKLYRVGFFVPYAVPTVIAALMWGFLYGRGLRPVRRHRGRTRLHAAELPERKHHAVVDRQRLDVDVHGLQHDHLLRRAASDPG